MFRRLGTIFLLGIAVLVLSNCTRLTLNWAPLTPRGMPAEPALLGALVDSPDVSSRGAWEQRRRGQITDLLSREVFGVLPDNAETAVMDRRLIDGAAFGGLGQYVEVDVRVRPFFAGQETPSPTADFTMAIITPQGEGPHPIILMETFCARWVSAPHERATRPEGASIKGPSGIFWYVFGRYNCTPPIEELLREGYGLAVVNIGTVVPDRAEAGLEALNRLAPGFEPPAHRWGAIAAWAWIYSRMADALLEDPDIGAGELIAYGHSRYGKAALLAAATDQRFAAVISHQSGTGGASLNRRKAGESVKSITNSYPHWFAPMYADFAGREEEMTVDQHHLLALIAPRPMLLGNARRDVWSDPNGAFKAAQAVLPVYELYGASIDLPDRLDQYDPTSPIAFWMRPGTHGTVEEDWPAFLDFLRHHVPTGPKQVAGP